MDHLAVLGADVDDRDRPTEVKVRPLAVAGDLGHLELGVDGHGDLDEFAALADTFDIGLDEMQWLSTNAMKSSFLAFDERLRLINGVIKPGYERIMAELQARSPRLV